MRSHPSCSTPCILARLALCAVALASVGMSSALAQPVFESVNRARGLPSDYINSVYQDRYGFMWFGTDSGLARYDGRRVETFSTDDGLPHPFVYDVKEDGEGTLWVGTFLGLARFDGSRFHSSPEPFGDQLVGTLLVDAKGRLVVRSATGIARKEGASWRVLPQLSIPFDVADVLPISGDRMLSVGRGALMLFEPDGTTFRVRTLAEGWMQGTVLRIAAAGGGASGTDQAFVASRKGSTSSIYRIRLDGDQVAIVDSVSVGRIRTIASDGRGGLVFYIEGGWPLGVYRMNADLQLNPTPLRPGPAAGFVYDYEGSLWIGTFGSGAFRLKAEHLRTITSSPATRIAFGPDGTVWASGDGLWRVDPDTYEVRHAYGAKSFREIHFSDAGEFWASSTQYVLRGPRRFGGEFVSFRSHPGWISGIDVVGDTVRMSSYSGGIRRLVGGLEVDTLTRGTGLPTGMIEGLKRASGALWALTRSHGAFRIAGDQAVPVGREQGLPSSAVFSVYGASDGATWFGTDRGVARLAPGASRAVAMGEEVLKGQRVTALFERDGYVWVVGERTFYVVTADGVGLVGRFPILPDEERSINDAVYSVETDHVYLATTAGIVAVELAALPIGRAPRPRIAVRGVRVGDLQMPLLGSPLSAWVEPIEPGRHRVEVELAPLSFTGPVRTEVQLNDGDWSPLGTEHRIVFSELAAGAYRLHMRAVSVAGEVSSEAAVLEFTIAPYWWQRPVSMVLLGLLALGLLVVAVRYIFQRRLREQIRALEVTRRLHDERERISRDLHDHVGAQLSSLIAGVELARLERRAAGEGARPAGRAESFDPLDGVEADARTTMRQLRETIWALHGASVSLDEFCTRVRSDLTARRTDLDTRVTCLHGPEETLSPVQALNLFRITQEAVTNALKHAEARQLDVTLSHDGTTVQVVVRDDGVFRQPGGDGARPLTGFGIQSMEARAEQLGGELVIDICEGTTVRVSVPADSADVS